MAIHCPTCNRSSDEIRFVGNFCEACVVERLKRNMPDRAIISTCRFCGRVAVGNEYAAISNKSLSKVINTYLRIRNCNIKVRSFDGKMAHCEAIFAVDNDFARFPLELHIKDEHKTCQTCYRKSSGYFEAVIQLRGDPERVERMVVKIAKYVEKKGAFVGKVDKQVHGSDVYVSDKTIANEFFSMTKLKPKRSYVLYGLVRGREVYRNVYSLYLDNPNPRFRVSS